MTSSDDLYSLIKSLRANEKRHFKLFSALQYGEKKYLKIFDAMEAQKIYDEKAIIKKFSKEKFIKNFSVAKAYLLESILNSLEIFHNNKSIDAQLRKQITCIKILSIKKQYGLCLKLISGAKKTANRFDFYAYAYELSTLEESVRQNLNDIKWLEENHERIYRDENKILEKQKNFQAYRKVSASSFVRGTKAGKSRDVTIEKKFDKNKKNDLLNHPSKALSDRALITYYFLKGTEAYFRNDDAGSLKYFIELKKFIEKNAQYQKVYFYSYLYALNNIASTGIGILKFEEMLNHVGALKDIRHNSPAENANVLLRYYIQLSHMFIYYGRHKEAIESIPEIETWIVSTSGYELHRVHRLSLLINISIIYFMAGDFRSCLNQINGILNNEAKGLAYDMYGFVRLLNLIVHFELGNYNLLPSITRSTYRYYYTNNRLYKFETLILDFLRTKLPHIHTKEDQIAAFIKLKSGFKKITEDPLEKNALGHFDFISWLESKIQNRPFIQVISDKDGS